MRRGQGSSSPRGSRLRRTTVALPLSAGGKLALGRCEAVAATASMRGAGVSVTQSKTFKAPRPCVPAVFTEPLGAKQDPDAFNVSTTMGERVACSLLRGAGERAGKGDAYRSAHDACVPFANDALMAPGADVK